MVHGKGGGSACKVHPYMHFWVFQVLNFQFAVCSRYNSDLPAVADIHADNLRARSKSCGGWEAVTFGKTRTELLGE